MKRFVLMLMLVAPAVGVSVPAEAQTAICYNCPPEWADWASQLRSIKAATGITIPHDNKNSGQTLSQLIAEKARPVADVAYFGVTFGIQARKEGVVAPYKPAFDKADPERQDAILPQYYLLTVWHDGKLIPLKGSPYDK